MSALALLQQAGVALVGLLTLAYLFLRLRARRLSGNCCGAKQCPATKQILARLEQTPG